MAGLIALVQTDIKRVIAYSTMSQIGYMFVGVGVGAYSNGDVPPADARVLQGAAVPRRRDRRSTRSTGEQDMRKMGGLAQADADARTGASSSARSRSSASRRSPASSRRTRSSPRRSRAARFGCDALRRRARRRVPDRRSTRSACSSSSSGASRAPFVAASTSTTAPRQGSAARDVLARRRPRRARDVRRLDPVRGLSGRRSRTCSSRRRRRSSRRPATQEAGVEHLRRRVRARRDRRRVGDLRRAPRAGAARPRSTVLEHKFWFDELYDAAFYRPAVVARARACRWSRAAGDHGSLARGRGRDAARRAGRRPRCRPACSARMRSRSRRHRSPRPRLHLGALMRFLADHDPDLPARSVGGALVCFICRSAATCVGGVRALAGRARRGRLLDRGARAASTSRRACSSSSRRRGSATSTSRTTSACTASRSGSSA